MAVSVDFSLQLNLWLMYFQESKSGVLNVKWTNIKDIVLTVECEETTRDKVKLGTFVIEDPIEDNERVACNECLPNIVSSWNLIVALSEDSCNILSRQRSLLSFGKALLFQYMVKSAGISANEEEHGNTELQELVKQQPNLQDSEFEFTDGTKLKNIIESYSEVKTAVFKEAHLHEIVGNCNLSRSLILHPPYEARARDTQTPTEETKRWFSTGVHHNSSLSLNVVNCPIGDSAIVVDRLKSTYETCSKSMLGLTSSTLGELASALLKMSTSLRETCDAENLPYAFPIDGNHRLQGFDAQYEADEVDNLDTFSVNLFRNLPYQLCALYGMFLNRHRIFNVADQVNVMGSIIHDEINQLCKLPPRLSLTGEVDSKRRIWPRLAKDSGPALEKILLIWTTRAYLEASLKDWKPFKVYQFMDLIYDKTCDASLLTCTSQQRLVNKCAEVLLSEDGKHIGRGNYKAWLQSLRIDFIVSGGVMKAIKDSYFGTFTNSTIEDSKRRSDNPMAVITAISNEIMRAAEINDELQGHCAWLYGTLHLSILASDRYSGPDADCVPITRRLEAVATHLQSTSAPPPMTPPHASANPTQSVLGLKRVANPWSKYAPEDNRTPSSRKKYRRIPPTERRPAVAGGVGEGGGRPGNVSADGGNRFGGGIGGAAAAGGSTTTSRYISPEREVIDLSREVLVQRKPVSIKKVRKWCDDVSSTEELNLNDPIRLSITSGSSTLQFIEIPGNDIAKLQYIAPLWLNLKSQTGTTAVHGRDFHPDIKRITGNLTPTDPDKEYQTFGCFTHGTLETIRNTCRDEALLIPLDYQSSFVDLGSGLGHAVIYFGSLGVNCVGFENIHSRWSASQAALKGIRDKYPTYPDTVVLRESNFTNLPSLYMATHVYCFFNGMPPTVIEHVIRLVRTVALGCTRTFITTLQPKELVEFKEFTVVTKFSGRISGGKNEQKMVYFYCVRNVNDNASSGSSSTTDIVTDAGTVSVIGYTVAQSSTSPAAAAEDAVLCPPPASVTPNRNNVTGRRRRMPGIAPTPVDGDNLAQLVRAAGAEAAKRDGH